MQLTPPLPPSPQAHRHVALIVGASSGIGAALAACLVAQGYRVVCLARREDALLELVTRLNQDNDTDRAHALVHDATNYAQVPALFNAVLDICGRVDLVIYNAGVMPEVAPHEYNFDKDRTMIEVNVLGAMAWCNEAAHYFRAKRSGTIVGISSVAGDRGRKGNPAYAASKAALSTYLESLYHRLHGDGVHVLTVKPGPVRTPMTEGKGDLPLIIDADEAAQQIWQALQQGPQVCYVPGVWRPLMSVIRHIPTRLFRHLSI